MNLSGYIYEYISLCWYVSKWVTWVNDVQARIVRPGCTKKHTCMWTFKVDIKYHSSLQLLLQCFSIEPRACQLANLAGKIVHGFSVLASSSMGLQAVTMPSQLFYIDPRDLNSDPHIWTESVFYLQNHLPWTLKCMSFETNHDKMSIMRKRGIT